MRVEGGRAGKTTLPWYLRHRVPAGFCLMAGPGAGEVRGLSRGDDWHFDIAFKGRLYGVAAGPVRVGLPCVYVGTSGVGAGVDLSLARAPLVSLDVGWFYPRNVIQAGVSVVVTPGP